jgi:ABC-type multidrug transport system ATPase subunit
MHIKNLHFQHEKNGPYFFKDISFSLEPSKLNALHGKNGTGKTILLNILARKVSIQSGELPNIKNPTLVNQRFDQMIADQFSFQDNLKFACMRKYPSSLSTLKTPTFTPSLIDKFHIDPSKPVYKLSGGQRQILSLLMVLQRPIDLLLLDEPTATLDTQNATLVFDFLSTLQNITLLIVCHDKELIDRYTTGRKLSIEINSKGERDVKT